MAHDFGGTAALGSDTRNQKEGVGHAVAQCPKCLRTRGACNDHEAFRSSPLEVCVGNRLVHAAAVFERQLLQVVGSRIAGESEANYPLSVAKKGLYAVAPHVRSHRNRVVPHYLKDSLGVAASGITNVAALGVGDE